MFPALLTRGFLKHYFHNMSFTVSPEIAPAPASLWRNRNFGIAIGAKTVSLLGDEAALIALTLRTQGSGAGAWAVSLLLIAGFAPLVCMAPLTGVLVDRFDSRRLLVGIGLAQAALCLLLAHVTAQPLVLALVFALGAGQSVTSATWSALLPGIVGKDRLGAANGISQSAMTATMVLAPILGGVLTGLGGAVVPLTLDAATYLAVAAAGGLISHRRGRTSAPGDGGWRAGLQIIAHDPVMRPLVSLFAAFVLLAGMANVASVFLIRETLHASAAWYGLDATISGVAMVCGSVLAGRITSPALHMRSALLGVSGLAVALCISGAAPSVIWLVPGAVLAGVSNAVLNVSASTLMMLRSPEAARGRISAATSGIMNGAMVGAMVLGGGMTGALSPRLVFLLGGAVSLLVPAVLARRLLRASRTLAG